MHRWRKTTNHPNFNPLFLPNFVCSNGQCFFTFGQPIAQLCGPLWATLRTSLSNFADLFEQLCGPLWATLRASLSNFAGLFEQLCGPLWATLQASLSNFADLFGQLCTKVQLDGWRQRYRYRLCNLETMQQAGSSTSLCLICSLTTEVSWSFLPFCL